MRSKILTNEEYAFYLKAIEWKLLEKKPLYDSKFLQDYKFNFFIYLTHKEFLDPLECLSWGSIRVF